MKTPIRVKILLVDDREDNLLSMESILAQDDYVLVKANSGKEALKVLLKEWDFTLILMDVEMPILNGIDTAMMIYEREKLRHIPIIFITAHNYNDNNIYKGYKAGAVDYIYKPIQAELLRAKVAVFADLYRKNHQLITQEQTLMMINQSLEDEVRDRIASEEQVKELNQQLLDNIRHLESINRELDRFAYMASHDLQEPLRKIRLFCDRILSRSAVPIDKESRADMDKIESSCARMQNLIDDILTFSKIAVNKDSMVHADMNALLDEVMAEMEMQIQEKEARLLIGKIPRLAVHPGLIKQLFQNLISNSLKYSRLGIAPEVKISALIEEIEKESTGMRANTYCTISVEDNGIGFEQQYADQAFTMFKRLHLNTEYEGTGIGLAICKKIVEQHQGFINVTSTLNQGTTFVIRLPTELPEPLSLSS